MYDQVRDFQLLAGIQHGLGRLGPLDTPVLQFFPEHRAAAGATLQIDDTQDRSWRRVGLALDRSGFTVEERNRTQGSYVVRYVDPKLAGKAEPGFFSRVFGGEKKEDLTGTRYRLKVVADGSGTSTLSVLNDADQPAKDDGASSIMQLLASELR